MANFIAIRAGKERACLKLYPVKRSISAAVMSRGSRTREWLTPSSRSTEANGSVAKDISCAAKDLEARG